MERTFVDEVRVQVMAGDGGNGAVSFRREKYRPKGGPDGGNGGSGGSIVFRVDPNVSTLGDLARSPHLRAKRGAHGGGNTKHGAGADDVVVLVPDGTVAMDEHSTVLADLVGEGTEWVAAAGGRGGRGNAAFAGPRRKAPGFAERGEPGEERWLRLELRLLADVGLVGFPNAGKSSLISRLTAARPAVAAYPFTTLTPHLGVARTEEARFVIADVPGLIEGASEGRGLGLRFLRHLQRCRVLCFVLDLASEEMEPAKALAALRAELRAYEPAFDARRAIVAGNKIDLPGARDRIAEARAAAETAGFAFHAVSAETGEGVDDLGAALGDAVERSVTAEPPPRSHALLRIRPEADTIRVEHEQDGAWRVHAPKAERLVQRFGTENPDAVAYLQDRLASLGVEDALSAAGARAGDEVRIGAAAFDFVPDREPEEERP